MGNLVSRTPTSGVGMSPDPGDGCGVGESSEPLYLAKVDSKVFPIHILTTSQHLASMESASPVQNCNEMPGRIFFLKRKEKKENEASIFHLLLYFKIREHF